MNTKDQIMEALKAITNHLDKLNEEQLDDIEHHLAGLLEHHGIQTESEWILSVRSDIERRVLHFLKDRYQPDFKMEMWTEAERARDQTPDFPFEHSDPKTVGADLAQSWINRQDFKEQLEKWDSQRRSLPSEY